MTTSRHAAYSAALDFAEQQVAALTEKHPDFFPIYTTGGKWHHGGELWTDWTGGFLAGMMWQFHLREISRGLASPHESQWRNRLLLHPYGQRELACAAHANQR